MCCGNDSCGHCLYSCLKKVVSRAIKGCWSFCLTLLKRAKTVIVFLFSISEAQVTMHIVDTYYAGRQLPFSMRKRSWIHKNSQRSIPSIWAFMWWLDFRILSMFSKAVTNSYSANVRSNQMVECEAEQTGSHMHSTAPLTSSLVLIYLWGMKFQMYCQFYPLSNNYIHTESQPLFKCSSQDNQKHFRLNITSRWPLKAAWCSAVRPALSDTFTLLSSGTRASAQRTALFAAAMWSGVCQFLSRAFTSAECFSNTWTASLEKVDTCRF